MQVPLRVAEAIRPSVAAGTILAVAYSTIVLVATPFLIRDVVEVYDVGLGQAALVSVFQLTGFVVGSFTAGRLFDPRPSIVRAALILAFVSNAVCATVPPWGVFLGARAVSGLALGLITWFAWSQAFGSSDKTSDIAVIGPLIGVVAAPVLAVAVEQGGLEALFVVLALLALVPLPWSGTSVTSVVERTTQQRRTKAVPAAKVILWALFAFTLGGSAVFQFVVVLAHDELDMSTSMISLAFSLNALAGIPAARWTLERRGHPGPWMAATGAMAWVVSLAWSPWTFAGAIVVWGFTFWMAMPGAYAVLAARSAYPEQRAGDAQALMAAGRVVGPLVGGIAFETFGNEAFGVIAFVIIAGAGAAIYSVSRDPALRMSKPGL